MVKKIGKIMIEIKQKNTGKKEDLDKQIKTLIKKNEIIEINVNSEFEIHIDDIDLFSDELQQLVEKFKKK